jgi:hypothetical protein
MPLLLNVPCFEGVRIHSGDRAKDTRGCILGGERSEKDQILESRSSFDPLFEKMKAAFDAGEGITIAISEEREPSAENGSPSD